MRSLLAPVGSRKNIEQGRGSSARRLCHENALKKCFQDHEKSRSGQPQRNQKVYQGDRGLPGRLRHKVLKEKRSAMPEKTAKTAAKATGSKTSARKLLQRL